MNLVKLNFPAYSFSYREERGRSLIFDKVRKQYVVLSPEEWVRQHVIRYLQEEKGYPTGLLSVEGSLNLFRTKKRYDVAAFDREGKPMVIVECKSPQVKLNQGVVDQVVRYNLRVKAPFLFVTNGMIHLFLKKEGEFYKQVPELPDYKEFPG